MNLTSIPWGSVIRGILVLVLMWQVTRLLHTLWWHPRRLGRALHAHGLKGTSYRFLTDDIIEAGRQNREAWSKPMPLGCHDISPHIAPFLHDVLQKHGKTLPSKTAAIPYACGTSCVSWLGPIPKVTIVDPSLAKEVMSNKFGHFEKLRFPSLSMLLAKGVADYEGEKWAKHRRILNPAFHLEKLKVKHTLDLWRLTGDVISRTTFGSSYLEGREIFHLQSEQAGRLLTNLKKIIIPGHRFLPTRDNRRMHQTNRKIESILRTLTEKRMKETQEGESTKDDLLGLMLNSNMTATDENGQPIPRMTIEETTSVLLTWTMILPSMHPEWQYRARDEVLGIFGKNKPEYEGFSRLKTVTMILYEVLRLYPPAITFIRKTCKDMKIGGIAYPADVLIELPLLFIHHDLEIWGSDALEFNPKRFAEGISKASKDVGALLPFGWGPRVCIGEQFALLQHFEFSLAAAYTHAPHNVTLLRPMHGAQIILNAI
ncbi:hypothetical protein ZWY2020_050498 [Hordeum vulgare]|nr:hypothetical protein ZWY2020_050498 [Hordeum vulgare]